MRSIGAFLPAACVFPHDLGLVLKVKNYATWRTAKSLTQKALAVHHRL
jgi:hypothetical protein